MDLSIIARRLSSPSSRPGIDSGAFVAALLIGPHESACVALGTRKIFGMEIAFPKLTLVAEFVSHGDRARRQAALA
jgi:hypothetical protein